MILNKYFQKLKYFLKNECLASNGLSLNYDAIYLFFIYLMQDRNQPRDIVLNTILTTS